MSSTADLNQEINRLVLDLQHVHHEKIQAAEYGLAVLEEKQVLQEKYDELETRYENTKSELAQVKEKLGLLKSKNDALAQSIENRQGNIVQESATRESAFATKISDLQIELKKAKKAERSANREVEHFKQQYTVLQKDFDTIKEKREQLAHENKELKIKDSRFNDEYNMLEEENTSLQKNISRLKQTLVEFEGLKVENKSLLDELDSLQLQLQMTTDARNQFEKQLHEALSTLKEQRERNAHHQKEIHELKQKSIMRSWQMQNGEIKYGNEDEHPIIKQITEEYKTAKQPAPTPGLVEDLMKELQFTEIRDLEEQLRIVEEEKNSLVEELNKKSLTADHVLAEASKLCRKSSSDLSEEESDDYALNNQLKEVSDLKEALSRLKNREVVYQLDIKRLTDELDEMKELVLDVENERNILAGEKAKLIESQQGEHKNASEELLQMKSKLREADASIKTYKEDIRMLKEMAGEAQGSLNCTQDELLNVFNELKKLQRRVIKIDGVISDVSNDNIQSDEKKSPDRGSAKACYKLITEVKNLVQSLQISLEKAGSSVVDNALTQNEEEKSKEASYLKEQLLKLQNLLATKREQIATLRTVLKANKSTYEVALANLKSRYENDKATQSQQNSLLKRQIKALRNECQTFASLRSMYVTRCEDYAKEIDKKEQALMDADEEKKILNTLLKQAIHQKISATQRLEEFEIARERLRQFTKKNLKSPPNQTSGKTSLAGKPVTRV